MTVSLSYFSESIFAEMVNRAREPFLDLCGLLKYADLDFVRSAPELASCEAQLEPLGPRSFDGASRIDVVVRLRERAAVAFELKLGTTRLSKTRVDQEWLSPCVPSHRDKRWSGNMIAILDRRFSEAVPDDVVARVGAERLTLSRAWFIVARQEVLSSWSKSPPAFSEHVRFCALEDVVHKFGGRTQFNSLVREMLDFDYYAVWGLGDTGDRAATDSQVTDVCD